MRGSLTIARALSGAPHSGQPAGDTATEPPVDLDARVERFRAGVEGEGGAALWVLEAEGRVVGQAGVHAGGTDGVLSLGMAILHEARGAAAAALLEAMLGHARSAGAHKLELEVWPDNGRAVALYASAGFEVDARTAPSSIPSLLRPPSRAPMEPGRSGRGRTGWGQIKRPRWGQMRPPFSGEAAPPRLATELVGDELAAQRLPYHGPDGTPALLGLGGRVALLLSVAVSPPGRGGRSGVTTPA